MREIVNQIRCVFIIPTFNNCRTIAGVVDGVKNYGSDIIVVNDGSTDKTGSLLNSIEGIRVITFEANRGKGAALRAAFDLAVKEGFTHAITLDADGQHVCSDIPVFLEKMNAEPDTLWVGDRIIPVDGGKSQPAKSRFGRRFGAFWFKFYTGLQIRDTQSGFRCYPLQKIMGLDCKGNRYEYEIELLIASAWVGTPVKSVPVHLLYQSKETRVSHFRPIKDFLRISKVNAHAAMSRLLLPRSIVRSPGLNFFRKMHLLIMMELKSNASPFGAAMSIAVGAFIGILPIHGIQVVTLLALSLIFPLNRPLGLLGVGISSPPLLPFWIAAGLVIGRIILPEPAAIYIVEICKSVFPAGLIHFVHSLHITTLAHGFVQWFVGSILLAVICGVITFFIAYPIFKKFRIK